METSEVIYILQQILEYILKPNITLEYLKDWQSKLQKIYDEFKLKLDSAEDKDEIIYWCSLTSACDIILNVANIKIEGWNPDKETK